MPLMLSLFCDVLPRRFSMLPGFDMRVAIAIQLFIAAIIDTLPTMLLLRCR